MTRDYKLVLLLQIVVASFIPNNTYINSKVRNTTDIIHICCPKYKWEPDGQPHQQFKCGYI